jgi:hypothetical protein
MPFEVPDFPLFCNIISGPGPILVVRHGLVPCNLAIGRRANAIAAGLGLFYGGGNMSLLLPSRTDVRDFAATTGFDIIECPAGTLRYYGVTWVDDVGRGYANEYRFAAMVKFGPWPTPYP